MAGVDLRPTAEEEGTYTTGVRSRHLDWFQNNRTVLIAIDFYTFSPLGRARIASCPLIINSRVHYSLSVSAGDDPALR